VKGGDESSLLFLKSPWIIGNGTGMLLELT